MNTKILNIINPLSKIFFTLCVFVSPLVFFTDLTRNPFNIQTLVLVFSCAALLVLWAARVLAGGVINIKYSTADFLFLGFVFIALLSLGVNVFIAPQDAPALLGEFLRRGHTLITNALAAWFIAKYFLTYQAAAPKENLQKGFYYIFAWAAAWLLFGGFKSQNIFDIYALIVWAAGIYLCARHMAKNTVKEAMDIFIAVAALACAYGIAQNLGYDPVWDINISYQFGARAVSTFGNPNFLSSYLILFTPLAFVYFLKAEKKIDIAYYFCALLLFAAYLVISATRSSWLGIAGGMFILFLFGGVRATAFASWKRAALVFVCCVLVFAAWPAQGGDNYQSAAAARVKEAGFVKSPKNFGLNVDEAAINQAWHQRLMMWTCAEEMLKSSPMIGRGWGAYQLHFAPCQGRLAAKYPQLDILRTQANSAHNDIFEVAAQAGLLGLLAYLSFFAAFVYLFVKNYKKFDSSAKLFYAALFAGAAAFFFDNMLNITMQASITAFAFWFVVSSLNLTFAKDKRLQINKITAVILLILCIAAAVILGMWQAYKIAGDIYDFKAHKLFAQNNYRAAALEARKALNPANRNAESYYTLINSHIKLNETDEASSAVSEAIKYSPHYFEFYFRAAALAAAQGNNELAARHLARVLSLYPAYYPAAQSFTALIAGDTALETPDNVRVLEASSNAFAFSGEMKLLLAGIYSRQSNLPAAANAAAQALQADIFDPDALQILSQFGETDLLKKARAAQALKAALAKPQMPKDIESQIRSFAKEHPQDFAPAMLLAEFYFRTDNPQKAAEILLAVYPQNKNNPAVNFALASAYTALQNPREAAYYLNQILALNPHNELAARRLAALNLPRG